MAVPTVKKPPAALSDAEVEASLPEGVRSDHNSPPPGWKPFPYPIPKTAAEAEAAGWRVAGPLLSGPNSGISSAVEHIWTALVCAPPFSDTLPLRIVWFRAPGWYEKDLGRDARGRRRTRKYKVSAESVCRLVKRRYGDRLLWAQRAFGLRRFGDARTSVHYRLPPHVYDAWSFVVRFLRVGSAEQRALGAEAALYAHTYGPDALRTLQSTMDLEGPGGVRTLLLTWWRFT
jgi:hypothetical protein